MVGLVLLAPIMMAMLRTLVLRSGRDVPVARLATVIRVLVLLLVVLVLLLHRRSTCAPRCVWSRSSDGCQRRLPCRERCRAVAVVVRSARFRHCGDGVCGRRSNFDYGRGAR